MFLLHLATFGVSYVLGKPSRRYIRLFGKYPNCCYVIFCCFSMVAQIDVLWSVQEGADEPMICTFCHRAAISKL
jgi:hypothetical protein